MTAQTQSRVAAQRGDAPLISLLAPPMKAATKIFAGALVVSDAGYAAPGRTALGLIALGVARKDVDNSAGANGDLLADIERGAFPFNNSAGVDAITQAHLGKDCYIVDDNTVALTDGYGTRSKAGRIVEVTSSAVIVEVGAAGAGTKVQPAQILTFGMDLASIPAGNYVSHVMPFACRVKKVDVRVIKPATTAAKAATLTAKKGAAALTGGVVGLTSANCTPAGAEVAGSAITLDANSEFAAGDTLNITGSAITAFVEGTAELLVHVEQVG
jgi:hypothetical protein